jgi:hypothetical protein
MRLGNGGLPMNGEKDRRPSEAGQFGLPLNVKGSSLRHV